MKFCQGGIATTHYHRLTFWSVPIKNLSTSVNSVAPLSLQIANDASTDCTLPGKYS